MAEFVKTQVVTVNCPYCGNSKVTKWGKNANGKQTYRCKPCGKRFLDTGAVHGRRTPSNHVGAAISLFYRGMSYKQIAEAMVEMYDISEPGKRTLYEWVKDGTDSATEAMQDYPAHVGDEWVADEMQVKVGGENLWSWNVMDAKTRYVLATHLSPNRDTRAAVAVMQKAATAADKPPKTIKTDRLASYPAGIKGVFPETEHVQADGIRVLINNNLSERLQGTYRQRTKTLRGLDNLESGQRYLDGWTLTYNLFREHDGIDYQTPGEMARVNAPFKQWEDVVKQHPTAEERPGISARDAAAKLQDTLGRDESAAKPNVHFVPDPTQRRRPKGETDAQPWPPPIDDDDASPRVAMKPKMPEPSEPVTRLTLPPARQPASKTPTVKVAATTPKPSTPKRHPFLRPTEQEQADKGRTGKRQRQYAKARKAHQQKGRKSGRPALVSERRNQP